jgi:hypothetical protein
MKRLDDEDKQIIRNISNIKDNGIKTVGSLIAHLFKTDESALLIYDKIYILTAGNADSTVILVLMAKIMSLIDSLQNEGYLYLIPNKENLFIQNGADSSVSIDTYGNISCCRGIFVIKDCDISLEVEKLLFISIAVPEKFEESLKRVICNYVYPTTKLLEFVKNDFAFGEELRYKTELKNTRRGLWISLIALFISIVSPFWMTCYNNKYAVTTIDSSQINKIVYAIQNLDNFVCVDSQLVEEQNVTYDTLEVQCTQKNKIDSMEHKGKVVIDANAK